MPSSQDSTARARELGGKLREWREAAGMSGKDIARKLGWSESKVSRLETGVSRFASEVDLARFLAYCEVPRPELDVLMDMYAQQDDDGYWLQPHREQLPGELRSLIIQESTANRITNYEPLIVPGLLQTDTYARAAFREAGRFDETGVDIRVQTRIQRQEILSQRFPPDFVFYIHEQALRLPVGGPQIMQEQMLHLLFLDSRPQCRIRVVPISAGARTGTDGPFLMLDYPANNPVVCVECHVASLFLEQPDDITEYRSLLKRLAGIALNEGQSRTLLAELASEYDRAEEDHDAANPADPPDLAHE